MSDVITGCLLAAAVMLPAACAGFVVMAYVKSRDLAMPTMALFSGAIRLLLAAAGSAIIVRFVPSHVVWFLVWLGIFYSMTLVAEIYFAISTVNRQKEQRLVTSWD